MRGFIMFLLILYYAPIYSINIVNGNNLKIDMAYRLLSALSIEQDVPDYLVYKYGVHKIIKEHYIYNLEHNVRAYLSYKKWNYYCKEEFIKAYTRSMAALKERNRLYADSFGYIIDTKGELTNVDGDDYWYDKKGNRITGAEYRTLSARKQKKYYTFQANQEVATYFNEIADAIVKEQMR